jgi:hypothetical protein
MSLDNGRERFRKAIGILIDERERIKKRLLIAYASQLSGVDPSHDLPESMVSDFNGLKNVLSDAEMPYGYGEHAAKKLHDMSEDDASELARTIFAMFLTLHELQPEKTSS